MEEQLTLGEGFEEEKEKVYKDKLKDLNTDLWWGRDGECDVSCSSHKLATHMSCMYCPAYQNSPYCSYRYRKKKNGHIPEWYGKVHIVKEIVKAD